MTTRIGSAVLQLQAVAEKGIKRKRDDEDRAAAAASEAIVLRRKSRRVISQAVILSQPSSHPIQDITRKLLQQIDVRLFAHVVGDSFVSDSPSLSGLSQYAAAQYLMDFISYLEIKHNENPGSFWVEKLRDTKLMLSSVIKMDRIIHDLTSRYKEAVETKIEKSKEEENIEEDIKKINGINKEIYELAKNLYSEIHSLNRGESLTFPSGWTVEGIGHALIITISCTDYREKKFSLVVGNTGLGLGYHPRIVDKEGEERSFPFLSFEDLVSDDLDIYFIKALLDIRIKTCFSNPFHCNSELFEKFFYENILFLIESKLKPCSPEDIKIIPQRAGHCGFRSILLAIRGLLQDEFAYKKFKLELNVFTLSNFQNSVTSIEEHEQRLFVEGRKNLARLVMKRPNHDILEYSQRVCDIKVPDISTVERNPFYENEIITRVSRRSISFADFEEKYSGSIIAKNLVEDAYSKGFLVLPKVDKDFSNIGEISSFLLRSLEELSRIQQEKDFLRLKYRAAEVALALPGIAKMEEIVLAGEVSQAKEVLKNVSNLTKCMIFANMGTEEPLTPKCFVALSNIFALKKLGAKITICGPKTLIPAQIDKLGVRVTYDLREALQGADVINVLRIQLERQDEAYFPSVREYAKCYGINAKVLKKYAKEDLVIMHPGPINRGIELSHDVADSKYSVILDQVTNGVAVRMAVLFLLSHVHNEASEE